MAQKVTLECTSPDGNTIYSFNQTGVNLLLSDLVASLPTLTCIELKKRNDGKFNFNVTTSVAGKNFSQIIDIVSNDPLGAVISNVVINGSWLALEFRSLNFARTGIIALQIQLQFTKFEYTRVGV